MALVDEAQVRRDLRERCIALGEGAARALDAQAGDGRSRP
jgi:hypothetical protein